MMTGLDDSPFEDYYDLLGVDPSADQSDIEAAYRERIKEAHPDVQSGDESSSAHSPEQAALLVKHLDRARDILLTPAKRREYDHLGHEDYLLKHHESNSTVGSEETRDTSSSVQPSAPNHGPSGGTTSTNQVATDPTASANGGVATESAVDSSTASSSSPGTSSTPGRHTDPGRSSDISGAESDPAPELEELIQVDILEQTWQSFRRMWRLRVAIIVTALVAIPAALAIESGSVGLLGYALPLGITVSAVVASGSYSMLSLAVEDEPTEPAPGASVGLLRPKMTRSYLRRATISGTLSLALTLSSGLSPPHGWSYLRGFILGPPPSHPWIPPGVLNAPKLVTPVNIALGVLLAICLLVTAVYGTLGISARVWLDRHSNVRFSYPVLWDAGSVACLVTLAYALLTGAQPFSPAQALPDLGLPFGIVNGIVTSLTAGFIALAVLVAMVIGVQLLNRANS